MTPVSAFVISFCCVSKCNSSKKKKHKILDKKATLLGWFELIVLKAWSLCVSLLGIFTVTCSGCVWFRRESVICAVLGLWLLYLNPWNCKIKRNVLTGCDQRACVSCISYIRNPMRVWKRNPFNALNVHQTFFDTVMGFEPSNLESLCRFRSVKRII